MVLRNTGLTPSSVRLLDTLHEWLCDLVSQPWKCIKVFGEGSDADNLKAVLARLQRMMGNYSTEWFRAAAEKKNLNATSISEPWPPCWAPHGNGRSLIDIWYSPLR